MRFSRACALGRNPNLEKCPDVENWSIGAKGIDHSGRALVFFVRALIVSFGVGVIHPKLGLGPHPLIVTTRGNGKGLTYS